MEILVGGRQTGKTHKLVEIALNHSNPLILVADVNRGLSVKHEIRQRLENQGIDRREAAHRAQSIVRIAGTYAAQGRTNPLYIDDVEEVLRRLLGQVPEVITGNARVSNLHGKRFEPYSFPEE